MRDNVGIGEAKQGRSPADAAILKVNSFLGVLPLPEAAMIVVPEPSDTVARFATHAVTTYIELAGRLAGHDDV